ncbi:DUF4393 domain-containing protein [Bradyrhizobium sp. CSA112]|uniref:Abi-alpha family protein n=1 Tax=Bradyrhizobium sp. CSA112 TaxID=2699170 RepID=UPI0023AF93A1|nr:Abi-alpha family protein [Bradyrhizobium sp. CSA112]MDE5458594.1 DUF4393 domain-containing protein [Bradyrhizobium sp. CSA112]
MSDHVEMPYEKAIEETAKTTGKAIDIVQSMSPAIASAYGFIIGDRINAARERQLDALARKTKKLLHDRNLEEESAVPEQLAIPLLEAAQGETREEIQDLYAALLANAMDANFADDVRPEFISTVKALQPLDAAILKYAAGRYIDRETRKFSQGKLQDDMKNFRPTAIELSIQHIEKLGCIVRNRGELHLSTYGYEFMVACNPNT